MIGFKSIIVDNVVECLLDLADDRIFSDFCGNYVCLTCFVGDSDDIIIVVVTVTTGVIVNYGFDNAFIGIVNVLYSLVICNYAVNMDRCANVVCCLVPIYGNVFVVVVVVVIDVVVVVSFVFDFGQ